MQGYSFPKRMGETDRFCKVRNLRRSFENLTSPPTELDIRGKSMPSRPNAETIRLIKRQIAPSSCEHRRLAEYKLARSRHLDPAHLLLECFIMPLCGTVP